MLYSPHHWMLQLVIGARGAEMQFLHKSTPTGTQVLDAIWWPMEPLVTTERAYLSELYQGALAFMETRA